MFSIRKSFFIVFILLGLLLGLFSLCSSAEANTADTAKWYVHAHVDNGHLKVEYIVEVGYVSGYPQQWNMTNRSVTELKCFQQGNPQIIGNSLYLDGNSLIKCAVPSFKAEVHNLSSGLINLEPYLTTQSILSIVDAKPEISRKQYSNPVYVMEENLEFFLPKSKANTRMILDYPNGQTRSGKFTSWGRTVFSITENCSAAACQFDHAIPTAHINTDPAPFLISLPTDESTFIIGYNPIHKTYFEGLVYDIFVDPFSRGPGDG